MIREVKVMRSHFQAVLPAQGKTLPGQGGTGFVVPKNNGCNCMTGPRYPDKSQKEIFSCRQ